LTIEDLPEPVPLLAPDIAFLRRQVNESKGQEAPIEEEEEDEAKSDTAGNGSELDKEMIYMGIVTSDSTVVYYKLTKGIKKPADIPDE